MNYELIIPCMASFPNNRLLCYLSFSLISLLINEIFYIIHNVGYIIKVSFGLYNWICSETDNNYDNWQKLS